MQLEIGISTSRYLPARGTAGLERSRVRGNRRVPCPPPIMMERTLPMLTGVIFVGAIPQSISRCSWPRFKLRGSFHASGIRSIRVESLNAVDATKNRLRKHASQDMADHLAHKGRFQGLPHSRKASRRQN